MVLMHLKVTPDLHAIVIRFFHRSSCPGGKRRGNTPEMKEIIIIIIKSRIVSRDAWALTRMRVMWVS